MKRVRYLVGIGFKISPRLWSIGKLANIVATSDGLPSSERQSIGLRQGSLASPMLETIG
ncbi:MAG: hypothetical protein J2P56_10690 [Verrucomicrobia bacterium]|nr:hypothetical protein [Verrucomicrobiota bacterium]